MKTQPLNPVILKIALERVLARRLVSYISQNAKTLLQWRCNAHFAMSACDDENENGQTLRILKNADAQKGFLLPTELRTKELSKLDVALRERAFFMATVNRAEILEKFRSKLVRVAEGELSIQEARTELRRDLDGLKYTPQHGQEDTIKDLRSSRRMNVSLETNLLQVQGHDRYMRQQAALEGFPAQRFVRVRLSRVPRTDWQARFAEAVGSDTAGANIREMAALVNHPCWTRLSRFGTPYPPFDFGSGMGLEPMDREEAEGLGLLQADDASAENDIAEMMQPQDRGLNEGLQARTSVHDRGLREGIEESLQGLARWEGNILVATDPNGTKPYTAEELGEVWSRPLPEAFRSLPGKGQMQKQALIEWVNENDDFKEKNYTDKWEDISRVHARLKPANEIPSLYRGLKIPDSNLDRWLDGIGKNGYKVRKEYPVESWTDSKRAAQHYANTTGSKWSVILEIEGGDKNAFKNISPLVRKFKDQLEKHTDPSIVTESEWLLARENPLKVKSIQKDRKNKIVRIQLQSGRGIL